MSGSVAARAAYLLYTANVSGAIENCKCGKNPRGGADRLKSFIDQFKKEHPGTILIDGGDFFNSYPFPELNQAMLHAQQLIGYDIVIPGEHEFAAQSSILTRYLQQNEAHLLVSNGNISEKSYRVFKKENFTVTVYSIIEPEVFYFNKIPDRLHLNGRQLRAEPTRTDTNFNIMILHGKSDHIHLVTEKYPWIDLILMAHDQHNGISYTEGKPVVGVGRDAESVAVIQLHRNARKISADVKLQEINLSLPADTNMAEIIKEYKAGGQTE